MDCFRRCKKTSIPYFYLQEWMRPFPHLSVGFSSRKEDQDIYQSNYAFHVGSDLNLTMSNRKELAKELAIPISWWTSANQVHGDRIVRVNLESRGSGAQSAESAVKNADALVTKDKNILLVAYFADCVPLFFYCDYSRCIGLAHAGWKGTTQNIASKTINELVELGAKKEAIRVAIGPSIGPCCYEVDEIVASPLRNCCQTISAKILNPLGNGRWKADLKQANKELLLEAGIDENKVTVSSWCTSCYPLHFHSYRRDKGDTGRMMAWIGVRDVEAVK